MKEIKNIKINFPNYPEQQKIGQFFQNLDQQIELQSDKLEHLKQSKQGYLQKMFANNNKKQPKLRFHNYYDKWKDLMIRDIAKVVGGGTPSTSNPSYWNGNINWYSPNEMTEKPFSYESIKKITELGLRNSSAKLHPINTILFTSRAGIGKMTIIKNPASTNQGFQSLELKNDVYPYFIYSMNRIIKHKAILLSSGSTFLEISKKNMEKIKLCIPSLPEQHLIGQFFSHLDHLIDLQQQKVDHLKRQKQAYLQKMFV